MNPTCLSWSSGLAVGEGLAQRSLSWLSFIVSLILHCYLHVRNADQVFVLF